MSLWLVPGGSVVVAFALAHLLSHLDDIDLLDADTAWYLFGGKSDGARELLNTFATSIISLTGVVFSISVLVLQLASNQYSPRVLRTFLSDRQTQVAMGLFLGSFTYTVVLLSKVRSSNDDAEEFVPRLAIFVAYVIVLGSVLVFVQYIHHMAHSIRAVNIIERIARETRHGIDNHYPKEAPYEPDHEVDPPASPPALTGYNTQGGGVLIAVDVDALLALACKHDAVVALKAWVGDFVPTGAPWVQVWGSRELTTAGIQRSLSLADERTAQQDPMFGFRQLVDIAERALSPSTNDPTTAIQVLDRLHDLLRILAPRAIPSAARVDENHRLRLILPRPDWNSYVRLSCDEVRHYGKTSVQVTRRLRAMLDDLLTVAPPDRKAVLTQQLALLDDALESTFDHPADRRAARTPSAQGHGPN